MQALKGSIVALVTPMMENDDIDYQSLESLIDWHIEQGTNGIVSVGTTGESATLDVKDHLDVIKYTINYANSRIPIIAGTGANSTSEAIELTEESRKLGADYTLIVTPYYNKPNQNGLIKHYLKLADSVDIPQILYNVPSRTACDLLPSSVKVLSEHKNIIGIKEAVNTDKRVNDLLDISKDNYDFMLFSGDDPTFLSMMQKGGNGVISVAANVVPNFISNICSLINNGKNEEAININNKLIFNLLMKGESLQRI